MSHQPDPRFFQAFLKHEWAKQHINQLHAFWQSFLQTDFCKIAVEDDPSGPGQYIRITSVSPIPANIPLLLGDAIHNLKSSLDYAINEMLGWKDTKITFPMGEEREELVDSFRTQPEIVAGRTKRKGRNAAIETAIPGIGQFIIDEIQPYKAANGFLWPLNKLDVRDKHRLLIPVLVPQTIPQINLVDESNMRMGTDLTFIVEAGGAFTPISSGRKFKIASHGKPTAEIFFNEPGIIENQRVFPTLLQMSQAVAGTIRRLDEFIATKA